MKTIYFVILGTAITEALESAFLEHGRFVGYELVKDGHVTPVLLLLAFLPTAIRFAHGVSIHMDVLHEKAYKPVFDFMGFLLQASVLYLMAETLDRVRTFAILFTVLIALDTSWLVILRWRHYLTFGPTEFQWLTTNGALVVLFAIAYVVAPWIGAWAAVIVAAAAIGDTVSDYVMNREFYFPQELNHKPFITTEPASTPPTSLRRRRFARDARYRLRRATAARHHRRARRPRLRRRCSSASTRARTAASPCALPTLH
jgi:hypothetical protein